MNRAARQAAQIARRQDDREAMASMEPLERLDHGVADLLTELGMPGDTAAQKKLAGMIARLAEQAIAGLAGEFIKEIDAGVIELAQRHKADPETLAIIQKMQRATHSVYVKTKERK